MSITWIPTILKCSCVMHLCALSISTQRGICPRRHVHFLHPRISPGLTTNLIYNSASVNQTREVQSSTNATLQSLLALNRLVETVIEDFYAGFTHTNFKWNEKVAKPTREPSQETWERTNIIKIIKELQLRPPQIAFCCYESLQCVKFKFIWAIYI